MFIINVKAWVGQDPEHMTFDKLVRANLDEYLNKVNAYYA